MYILTLEEEEEKKKKKKKESECRCSIVNIFYAHYINIFVTQ
jgi:hypothetical protein